MYTVIKDGCRPCSKCKKIKFVEDFGWRTKEKRVRLSWCKECFREYQREYQRRYKRNKRKQDGRQFWMKERYDRNKQFIEKAKDVPCMDCGIRYPSCAMDFDHRDPITKLFSISRGGARSLEKLQTEINKCDVVCANCHRMRTHGCEGNNKSHHTTTG